MKTGIICFAALVLFILNSSSFAQKDAQQIAKRYFDLQKPANTYSRALMVLTDRNGRERSRSLKIYTKRDENGTHTFMEFESPADVRGTRFLSIASRDGGDEQRIYLPALRRVRLIASSGKGGKFVGSNFFFYDLEDRSFDDYRYGFIGTQSRQGREYDIIEMVPVDENAPYAKAHAWVNPEDGFVYKMELYDRRSSNHIKTMTVLETVIEQECIIPVRVKMESIRDDHRTELVLEDLKVNQGVDDRVFTVQNLESR